MIAQTPNFWSAGDNEDRVGFALEISEAYGTIDDEGNMFRYDLTKDVQPQPGEVSVQKYIKLQTKTHGELGIIVNLSLDEAKSLCAWLNQALYKKELGSIKAAKLVTG